MARQNPVIKQPEPTRRGAWRGFLNIVAALCLCIAVTAAVLYLPVKWLEHQVLTADNWVTYASALPKNKEVSGALADKITKQVYANVPIEQKVAEALPPKAEFLAGPLSDQLQKRTVGVVDNTIASDTFQSLWAGANRLAIERFLSNARSTNKPRLSGNLEDKFNINLESIKPVLQKRLGSQSRISPALQEKSKEAIGVATDLQAKREQVWQYVRTADFIYAILPAIFIAAFLGMLAFASNRRRYIAVFSLAAIALLLVELVALKYARQSVLDKVQHPEYLTAVSYIFDSLVDVLKHTIIYGILFWIVVLAISLLSGPATWASSFRRFLHLDALPGSRPYVWWQETRTTLSRYTYWIWAGIIALGLIYLAFVASISTVVIINTVLLMLGLIFLTELLFGRRRQAASA